MFTTAGKKLEETSNKPARVDNYLKAMEKMSKADAIAPRIRFLIRDVLDLRRMKWVPRRETLKVGVAGWLHDTALCACAKASRQATDLRRISGSPAARR